MPKGKQTCKILKEIRKQIAAENDIELVISECTYQGDCKGTCPKCEAEVRYLERELEKRQRMGKAAVIAGMTVGTMLTATSCDKIFPRPLEGDVPYIPDSTEMPNGSIPSDTIPDEPFLLEGDVVAPVPDTLKEYVFEPKEDEDRPGVYVIVEQMPEFPGGDKGFYQYIADNIKYPVKAREKGIKGLVYVNFIVEPDGSVSNINVLRGIGGGCDEEAVRLVESMPKFKPGIQDGEAVKVSYTVPVNFKLQ